MHFIIIQMYTITYNFATMLESIITYSGKINFNLR